eukprot:Gb_12488 [translate_table: standard]
MSGEGATQSKAIGIDLGTTYSCVAVSQHDRVEIIVNDQGNRTTPSMVAFTPTHKFVGDAACYQAATNPYNTIFDAKRLIGRRYNDLSVQHDMGLWPFAVMRGKDDKPMIQLQYKGKKTEHSAEEISAMVLEKMKDSAEAYLNSSVKNVVVTVPAYFSDSQRTFTKDACTIAGLNVLQLLNEPTAAAIAYGLHTKTYLSNNAKNILVFDLGGGTFDVSVLTIQKGVFEVKAVGGDTHLGGQDFDNRMLDHFVQEFNRKHNKEMGKNPKALRRLRTACERVKRILSSTVDTAIDVDALHEGIDFCSSITRAKFEELNNDLFQKCMQITKQCLVDAKMSKALIDEVVLVGGSSRIPKVQALLTDFFDGKKLCKAINPDEAVAYGAAVMAAELSGASKYIVLKDITPLSLGIEVQPESMVQVVVPRNTPIPTRMHQRLTTAKDDQIDMRIGVYEGERAKSKDNVLLAEFVFCGIPAAPKGVSKIDLCFDIDANGILKVTAQDKTVGIKKNIIISREDGNSLSKQNIEKMLADAVTFKAEDEEAINKYIVHKALNDYVYNMRDKWKGERLKGKVEKRVLDEAEKSVENAFEWLKGKETDAETFEFEKKLKELKVVFSSLEAAIRRGG